jgi:hypothetical protein
MPRNKTTPPAKAGGLWNTLERAAATVVALASPSAGNTESKTEKSRGKREPLAAAAAAPKVNKRKSGREPAKPKEEDPQPVSALPLPTPHKYAPRLGRKGLWQTLPGLVCFQSEPCRCSTQRE